MSSPIVYHIHHQVEVFYFTFPQTMIYFAHIHLFRRAYGI